MDPSQIDQITIIRNRLRESNRVAEARRTVARKVASALGYISLGAVVTLSAVAMTL